MECYRGCDPTKCNLNCCFLGVFFKSKLHEYLAEPFHLCYVRLRTPSLPQKKAKVLTDILLRVHLIAQVSGHVTQYILSHISEELLTRYLGKQQRNRARTCRIVIHSLGSHTCAFVLFICRRTQMLRLQLLDLLIKHQREQPLKTPTCCMFKVASSASSQKPNSDVHLLAASLLSPRSRGAG